MNINIITTILITIAINAAVGWAFVAFTPLWVAAPFVVGAAINIVVLVGVCVSPERAYFAISTFNWYVWQAAKPVVRNIGMLFWEKEAVSGFVELMDTVYDTMPIELG